MNRQSKDLFDDSTMSFGEHLEVLRVHLWKSIIGIAIACVVTLFFGSEVIEVVRRPIDRALKRYQIQTVADDLQTAQDKGWMDWFLKESGLAVWFGEDGEDEDGGGDSGDEDAEDEIVDDQQSLEVTIRTYDLLEALHEADRERFPEPVEAQKEESVTLTLIAEEFAVFRDTVDRSLQPVTLNVQEAFMMYIKVSLVSGLLLSSPWVFWQIWQFVAAGLYPHERKFVYIYGALSLVLFVIGAVFCFYVVFPFVLEFLLGFNQLLGVQPQIRLSEWVSFALLLPLMFGISFQLPLVMRFLQALSIMQVEDFRKRRKIAIFIIAFLSMILTPADPMSMLLMMFPLIALYEFGIQLCKWAPNKNPFEETPATT